MWKLRENIVGLDSVEDMVSSENPPSRKLPSLETFLSFEISIRYMLTLLIYPMTFNLSVVIPIIH